MAFRRTGTEFVMKGFSQFLNGLKQINREYNNMNKTASKMAAKVGMAGERVVRARQREEVASKRLSIAEKTLELAHLRVVKAQNAEVPSIERMLSAGLNLEKALAGLSAAQDAVRNSAVDTGVAEKDLNTIIAGARSGMSSATVAIIQKTVAMAALNVAAGALVGTIRFLWSAIKKLGSVVLSAAVWPFRQLADLLKGAVQVAFGVLIRDAVRNAIDQLNRLRDALIKVVAEFQTLEIRIENLVARELRLTQGITNVAESFDAAVQPAAELSNWIRQLSLQVPFDVTDIANTTAFSLAMGFTTEEAKRLTLAISNFAAGMGLSSEKMQSIVFNFGQMKAAGKVTGTEMRDLARGAFLPLTDVLDETAKLLGVATGDIQEFRKQAAAGEVPINAFFQAFQNVVARDFPGAVERMGRTLTGVVQRFKNFLKTIFGVEILGPVMKRVAAAASEALDGLMTPAVQRAAAAIGKGLGIAFDRLQVKGKELWAALRRLAEALGFTGFSAEGAVKAIAYIVAVIRSTIDVIIGFIDDMTKKAGERFNKANYSFGQWGANLIISLAKGMVAAISAVVQALIKIGQVFKKWLESHSPPKLLPKLGQWGAAAMAEYMKGWLNVDFSVFNSIADKMESFFRSLPKKLLKETDLVPTILEWRDNLARAIATGANISTVFAGADAIPEFKKYAQLVVKVAAANKEVEKAQNALNKVTEKYDKILEPLNRQLDRLTDRGDEIDATRRITQLRLILADVNASAGDKERAQNEINRLQLEKQVKAIENEKDEAVAAAEDKLDAAEEHLAALESELEAQEALIDAQIKTNELIKEQLELLESLKEKGGAGGGLDVGEFDIPDVGAPDFDPDDFEFDIDFTKIFYEAQKSVDKFFADLKAQFAGLIPQINELKTVWGSNFAEMSLEVSKWHEATSTSWNMVTGEIDRDKADISSRLSELGIDFGGLGLNVEDAGHRIRLAMLLFSVVATTVFRIISRSITGFLDGWILMRDKIKEILNAIALKFGLWLAGLVRKLLLSAPKFFNWGSNVIQGIWDGMLSVWEDFKSWVEENFGWLIDLLKDIGVISSPSKVMEEHGKNLMLGLAKGMMEYAKLPINIMGTVASTITAPQQAATSSTVTNNNFTLNMPTTASAASVSRAFNVMSVMVG